MKLYAQRPKATKIRRSTSSHPDRRPVTDSSRLSHDQKKPQTLGSFDYSFANIPAESGVGHTQKSYETAALELDSGSSPPLAVTEIIKDQDLKVPSVSTRSSTGVRTVLKKNGNVSTTLGGSNPFGKTDRPKNASVAPGGAPATGDASNDCLPSTASAVLNWNVVSKSATHWGVDVRSLTLSGQVNVRPWTSNPNAMTVPNTPNPVDGGNINNTAGSSNHWQAAIDDLADYHTAGGGAGPNWHSTAASHAHEWAHWNTDYVADSVSSAGGGNWPVANTDLDALREAKASSATAADARTALAPQTNTRMSTWRTATIRRWNAIPDTPGTAGSTGYAAGKAVLDGHIAAIRAYKTTKGW